MKKILIVLICFTSFQIFSQKRAGEVQYNYTIFYDKIITELPFLEQAEKDRRLLTWGNKEGYSSKMKLSFNEQESLYTHDDSEDVGYSRRKEDFLIHRNFDDKSILELMETLGKTYLIKEQMPEQKWRIMNELKEIQGHLCMKAIMYDASKDYDVVAWFAADIPVAAGPEVYYGLPGLILGLEINNGIVLVEAEKLELLDESQDITLPKKMKGREIDTSTYQKMVKDYIKTSIASRRYPDYWSMRY
ncbi:MAG: GLPGLI family protein [Arcticibacterium sp.]|jgi:GLPGLI family protein